MALTLEDAINSASIYLGYDSPQSKILPLTHAAYAVVREITLDLYPQYGIKQTTLSVNSSNRTAALPEGFVDYIKVGVYLQDGRVYPLAFDADLLSERQALGLGLDNTNLGDISVYEYDYGYNIAKRFREPYYADANKNKYGSFIIDKVNEVIAFDNVLNLSQITSDKPIILVYLSNGLSDRPKDVLIDENLFEAVVIGICFKMVSMKMNTPNHVYQRYKQEWMEQKGIAQGRLRTITPDQALGIYSDSLNAGKGI